MIINESKKVGVEIDACKKGTSMLDNIQLWFVFVQIISSFTMIIGGIILFMYNNSPSWFLFFLGWSLLLLEYIEKLIMRFIK